MKRYSKRNNYYKVQRARGTAVLTLGKYIPEDWKIVRVMQIVDPKWNKPNEIALLIQKVV